MAPVPFVLKNQAQEFTQGLIKASKWPSRSNFRPTDEAVNLLALRKNPMKTKST